MCLKLLKDNSQEISAASGIAQVAATVLTIIALVVTLCQLNQAKDALRANTAYQIYKDGRELAATLLSDPDTLNAIEYNIEPTGREA